MEDQNQVGAEVLKSNTEPKKKMKKGWKIALISLGSLLGLVIVAVVVALWLVLTPARLTSIVNKLSDKFILCESHFENVDLTVIKTFPYVGLKVEGVSIVNPMDGAPNDTVAKVEELCVGINIREYLKHKNIEVTKLVLGNTAASLFTNADGKSNYDIFPSSEDTTASEPFKMPDLVSLKSIRVKGLDAKYLDLKSNIDANVTNAKLDIDGKYENLALDADLKMSVDGIDFAMKGDSSNIVSKLQDIALSMECESKGSVFDGDMEFYVKQGRLSFDGEEYVNDAMQGRTGNLLQLQSTMSGDMKSKIVTLENTILTIKDYDIEVEGDVTLPDGNAPMAVDVDFETNTWNVDGLLAMLPKEFTDWKKGMNLDADVELDGTAKGNVGGGKLPAVTAGLKLKNGHFSDFSILPYSFTGIAADVSAELNLNEGGVSDVSINKISANTGRNHVELSGKIDDLIPSMAKHKTEKYLVPMSDVHNDSIAKMLDSKKLNHQECVMYRTVSNDFTEDEVKNFDYDMLIFFSPSGIESLTKNFPNFNQGDIAIATFGPATAQAVKDAGLRLDLEAPSEKYPSMTSALQHFLLEKQG